MKPIGDYTVYFPDTDMYVPTLLMKIIHLTVVQATFSGRISCRSSFHATRLWKLQQASMEIKHKRTV